MLTTTDLKTWLHRDLNQLDKLLLVLFSMDRPCQVREIKDRACQAGFSIPKKWNPSSVLRRSKGMAIKIDSGWEITTEGIQHLRNLGVSKISPSAALVAHDLRDGITSIKDRDTYSFVDEAIKCYEAQLYRSAIVMSWIGAVSVLYSHIQANYLREFNQEAKKVNPRWKYAHTKDDFSRMKEIDFLDRIAGLSIIGKDVKQELKNCLTRRNSCGHPNSLLIGPNTAASHIEVLLLNVFQRFQ